MNILGINSLATPQENSRGLYSCLHMMKQETLLHVKSWFWSVKHFQIVSWCKRSKMFNHVPPESVKKKKRDEQRQTIKPQDVLLLWFNVIMSYWVKVHMKKDVKGNRSVRYMHLNIGATCFCLQCLCVCTPSDWALMAARGRPVTPWITAWDWGPAVRH